MKCPRKASNPIGGTSTKDKDNTKLPAQKWAEGDKMGQAGLSSDGEKKHVEGRTRDKQPEEIAENCACLQG